MKAIKKMELSALFYDNIDFYRLPATSGQCDSDYSHVPLIYANHTSHYEVI